MKGGVAARGLTPVVGIVLLIGIVGLASIGIVAVASDAIAEMQQQSEIQQAEQSFVQLSHEMESASRDQDGVYSMDLEIGDRGAIAKTDAGWMEIDADGIGSERIRLGAIEYEADDGTHIGYQAGGVWRGTGNDTTIVSTPDMAYNAAKESFSMSFPTTNSEAAFQSGTVMVDYENASSFNNVNLVTGEVVTVTIKSQYYRGWETYFESHAGDTVVKSVTEFATNESGIVTVELGLQEADGDFADGLHIGGGGAAILGPNAGGLCGSAGKAYIVGDVGYETDVNDECVDGNTYKIADTPTPIDPAIDTQIERTASGPHRDPTETATLTAGETYYADDDLTVDGYTVNLESGNVTLVVNGSVTIAGEFTIYEEAGHSLRIYADGDFHIDGSDVCVECDADDMNAEYIQVYGPSSMAVGIDGHYEGVIYAPRNEPALEEGDDNPAHEGGDQGNGKSCEVDGNQQADTCILDGIVYGSIVGGPFATPTSQGGNDPVLYWDASLIDVEPVLHLDTQVLPPELTYLNLVYTEVDVTQE